MTERWPLVGRSQSRAAALEAVETGRGALIMGPAGSGRSRLLRELVEAVSASGGHTVGAMANRGAVAVPRGALSHLVGDGARGGYDAAWGRLKREAGGPVDLLWVDDAQWLDDWSAGFVHHVATTRAPVLATGLLGAPLPDPVMALSKDRVLGRVELAALSIDEVGSILSETLGGLVEDGSIARLWALAEANLCFLDALVADARATGGLRVRRGVWCWEAESRVGPRLTELVIPQLLALRADQRRAVELLAIAGPLPTAVTDKLVAPSVMRTLERRGVVVVEGRAVVCSRAALAAVAFASLDPGGRQSLIRALSEALDDVGGDPERVVLWRAELGQRLPAQTLLSAGRRAAKKGHHATAERLAREAWRVDPSFAAGLAIGKALNDQARFIEAANVLDGLVGKEPGDGERARLAWELARGPLYEAAPTHHAITAFDRAETSIERPDTREVVRDLRAWSLAVHATDTPPRGQPLASAVRKARTVITGRDDPAPPSMTRVMHPTRLDATVEVLALQASGRVAEAGAVLDKLLRWVVDSPGLPSADAMLVTVLAARNDLLRGRPNSARRRLARSTAAAPDETTGGSLAWALALLAESLALLGRAHEGATLIGEARQALGQSNGHFSSAVTRAEAWVVSARGDPWAGAEISASLAEDLRDLGHDGLALHAAHDAVRLRGSTEDAARLAAVAGSIPGDWAVSAEAHARALLADDVEGLARAASAFECLEMDLVASDVWATTGRLAARRRARAKATRAARRAAEIAARCEGATTPGREASEVMTVLTRREHEVVALANTGLSNQEIAHRLGRSVRTVETHLYNAFAKLGVQRRGTLS